MRTFDCLLRVALVGAGLMAAAPAFALDGSKTDGSVGPPPMTPVEAFRSGAHWLRSSSGYSMMRAPSGSVSFPGSRVYSPLSAIVLGTTSASTTRDIRRARTPEK